MCFYDYENRNGSVSILYFLELSTPKTTARIKNQDRTIVAGPGMKPAPKLVPLGHRKDKVDKETPPDALIMNHLETFLSTTVNKACANTCGSIVEKFIKPRSSTMFGQPV